jgi:pimeloyl-ACP methyl ester carboxylesterase
MSYAAIRGAQIFYTDEGEGGPPLIFVHGWTCDSHDWMWQLPAFGDRRTIAFDLRGHGRSSAPEGGYDIPSLAADIAELMDSLDIAKAILIGHSLGGVISSYLASTAPERVLGVVVIDPPYGIDDEGARRNLELVAAMEAYSPTVVVADFLGILESPQTPPSLATLHRRRALGAHPEAILEVARGMHGSLDAIANLAPTVELLAARHVPVLAIHISPEKAVWERELFQHDLSRSVCLEGAGHWAHQEQPEEVNAIMSEWFSDVLVSRRR